MKIMVNPVCHESIEIKRICWRRHASYIPEKFSTGDKLKKRHSELQLLMPKNRYQLRFGPTSWERKMMDALIMMGFIIDIKTENHKAIWRRRSWKWVCYQLKLSKVWASETIVKKQYTPLSVKVKKISRKIENWIWDRSTQRQGSIIIWSRMKKWAGCIPESQFWIGNRLTVWKDKVTQCPQRYRSSKRGSKYKIHKFMASRMSSSPSRKSSWMIKIEIG